MSSSSSGSDDCDGRDEVSKELKDTGSSKIKTLAAHRSSDLDKAMNQKKVDRSSCGSNTASSSEVETYTMEKKHEKVNDEGKKDYDNFSKCGFNNYRLRSSGSLNESLKVSSEDRFRAGEGWGKNPGWLGRAFEMGAESGKRVFDGVQRVERFDGRRERRDLGFREAERNVTLTFHRRHSHVVRSAYIPHALEEAECVESDSRERRLFTNRVEIYGDGHRSLWSSVPFSHPSTFDTLAIEPTLYNDVRQDLFRFVARRDYYARVGQAWKRGYLLYGPPGTRKTSLIATIANLLEFDVYDLELMAVHSNIILHRLLAPTTPKSVVVIEDVECLLDLSDQKKKKNKQGEEDLRSKEEEEDQTPTSDRFGWSTVSLSGLLNFMDGIWSSCVGEKLMIFTTNHPERLNETLLQTGRMHWKIHLSYCGPLAFRILTGNYLEVGQQHQRMHEVEAVPAEMEMTPADIAEVFMRCDTEEEGTDAPMDEVVEEMQSRYGGSSDPRHTVSTVHGGGASNLRRKETEIASAVRGAGGTPRREQRPKVHGAGGLRRRQRWPKANDTDG
ncbi:hypothetical protein ZIOFF_014620 [Zingiber officinale]|uniref:AAA+ ATPase domain-containing protein n=1 Tax=Zingiber officinale TaxID=94328 RepID=A0A8J5LPM5_ZINOF|nr:hypothetical protein ZIOFF_014620 [Zingiber officinale]